MPQRGCTRPAALALAAAAAAAAPATAADSRAGEPEMGNYPGGGGVPRSRSLAPRSRSPAGRPAPAGRDSHCSFQQTAIEGLPRLHLAFGELRLSRCDQGMLHRGGIVSAGRRSERGVKRRAGQGRACTGVLVEEEWV